MAPEVGAVVFKVVMGLLVFALIYGVYLMVTYKDGLTGKRHFLGD